VKTASRPSAANSGLGGAGAPGPLLSVSVTPVGSCSPVVVGWGFLPAGTWVPQGNSAERHNQRLSFEPCLLPSLVQAALEITDRAICSTPPRTA